MRAAYDVTPDDLVRVYREDVDMQRRTLLQDVHAQWIVDQFGDEVLVQVGEPGTLWLVPCYPYYVEVAIPHQWGQTHTTVYPWGSEDYLEEDHWSRQGNHEAGAVVAAGFAVRAYLEGREEAA